MEAVWMLAQCQFCHLFSSSFLAWFVCLFFFLNNYFWVWWNNNRVFEQCGSNSSNIGQTGLATHRRLGLH
jgi:hypothetical protein